MSKQGRLETQWSLAFGLQAPVVNAPMGGAAGGALAAAVSEAGGLGMIGVGSAGSVEMLVREAEIPRVRGLRFGIGLLSWAIEREPSLLDAAIDACPALVSVSFGAPGAWVSRLHGAGIAAATQVYDVTMARQAADAGIDVIVARGSEGGGHGRNGIATLPLLQGVLDSVSAPILAAGGIGSARGLAAILAAGAAGAWMGTPFLACSESLLADNARRARHRSWGERHGLHTGLRRRSRLPLAGRIWRAGAREPFLDGMGRKGGGARSRRPSTATPGGSPHGGRLRRGRDQRRPRCRPRPRGTLGGRGDRGVVAWRCGSPRAVGPAGTRHRHGELRTDPFEDCLAACHSIGDSAGWRCLAATTAIAEIPTRPPPTWIAVKGCPKMTRAAAAATMGLLEPITEETEAST